MEEKEVLAQVSPESCEWFRRPKVAMSELVETGKKCGPSQREKEHFQGIGVSASRSGAFGGGARAHKHEECRNAGQEEHEEGVKKPDRRQERPTNRCGIPTWWVPFRYGNPSHSDENFDSPL